LISFVESVERCENICIIASLKGAIMITTKREFVLLTDKFAKILFNT